MFFLSFRIIKKNKILKLTARFKRKKKEIKAFQHRVHQGAVISGLILIIEILKMAIHVGRGSAPKEGWESNYEKKRKRRAKFGNKFIE